MSHPISFADLIAPTEVETFFQTYWEKTFLHLNRADKAFYDPILNINHLDMHFVSQQLSPRFLNVTKSGHGFPIEAWTTIGRRSGEAVRVVDPARLFSLYTEGATLVINGAHKAIPSLTRFCAYLENQFKFRVQTNLYITPPGSQGFPAHYDNHDVLALQINGCKHWRLYGFGEQTLPVENKPGEKSPDPAQAPQHTLDLRAGDLLYLPRGYIHDAVTLEEPSIHITLGLLPKYWFHLIEEIAQIAKENPIFRQALPHGLSSAADKADFIQAFETQFAALQQEIGMQTLLDRQTDAFVGDQLRDRQGQFSDLMQMSQLTTASVLSRRTSVSYVVKDREQQISVCFGEHEITIPPLLKSALPTILQNEPFAIGDIKGLITDQGKIDLITEFVRTGFLKIEHI